MDGRYSEQKSLLRDVLIWCTCRTSWISMIIPSVFAKKKSNISQVSPKYNWDLQVFPPKGTRFTRIAFAFVCLHLFAVKNGLIFLLITYKKYFVSVQTCFHDTLAICFYMDPCGNPPHNSQNLLAIVESFFLSWVVSITSFYLIFSFCTIRGVMVTKLLIRRIYWYIKNKAKWTHCGIVVCCFIENATANVANSYSCL